mmetsp:Transcript_19677/g.38739  ORF Transcript_19677/g.38739 Transcript_19677/m.38739 type:complete len:212 (-) Transcript_19677:3178-3813(-)
MEFQSCRGRRSIEAVSFLAAAVLDDGIVVADDGSGRSRRARIRIGNSIHLIGEPDSQGQIQRGQQGVVLVRQVVARQSFEQGVVVVLVVFYLRHSLFRGWRWQFRSGCRQKRLLLERTLRSRKFHDRRIREGNDAIAIRSPRRIVGRKKFLGDDSGDGGGGRRQRRRRRRCGGWKYGRTVFVVPLVGWRWQRQSAPLRGRRERRGRRRRRE